MSLYRFSHVCLTSAHYAEALSSCINVIPSYTKNCLTFMYIGKLKNVVLLSKWTPARNAFIFTKLHLISPNLQFQFSIFLLCNQLAKTQ